MDTNSEQLSIIADRWLHNDTPTFEKLSYSILQPHQSVLTNAITAANQLSHNMMSEIHSPTSDELSHRKKSQSKRFQI